MINDKQTNFMAIKEVVKDSIKESSQFLTTCAKFAISLAKVSFFVQCKKMQLITLQNFNTQTYFSQFLWVFSLKC